MEMTAPSNTWRYLHAPLSRRGLKAPRLVHSPAPCGRGLGGGVCARQRARESLIAGSAAVSTTMAPIVPPTGQQDSCAPAGARPRPRTPGQSHLDARTCRGRFWHAETRRRGAFVNSMQSVHSTSDPWLPELDSVSSASPRLRVQKPSCWPARSSNAIALPRTPAHKGRGNSSHRGRCVHVRARTRESGATELTVTRDFHVRGNDSANRCQRAAGI